MSTYTALLDQDAGKLLLCRAVDQQTGEGGKEDGWKLNINCKFQLQYNSTVAKTIDDILMRNNVQFCLHGVGKTKL
jgi:hypothetical protein